MTVIEESIRVIESLVEYIRKTGGYMTPEDQATLCYARQFLDWIKHEQKEASPTVENHDRATPGDEET